MLRLPTSAIHAAALAVSAAAHGAVLIATVGHPSARPSLLVDDPTSVDVTLDPAKEPARETEAEPPEKDVAHSAAAAPHTHTHPYPVPPSHDWTPHDPSLVHVFPHGAEPSHDDSPAPPPALTSESLPHFTIPASPAAPVAAAPAGNAGAGSGFTGSSGVDDAPPASEASVSTPARLVQGATPTYPVAARAQGIEADVPMELVVSRAGAVESARVLHHAGFGFDDAALAAIRGYRFSPAIRAGQPTRVVMRWTMQFRLR